MTQFEAEKLLFGDVQTSLETATQKAALKALLRAVDVSHQWTPGKRTLAVVHPAGPVRGRCPAPTPSGHPGGRQHLEPGLLHQDGQYLDKAGLVAQIFKPIVERANKTAEEEARRTGGQPVLLPANLRFHDLRHSHASLLIAEGWSIKAVSRRLGHGDEVITLRTYTHMMPSDDRRLADGFDSIVGGTPHGPSAAIGHS
jgi:integrase